MHGSKRKHPEGIWQISCRSRGILLLADLITFIGMSATGAGGEEIETAYKQRFWHMRAFEI